MLGTKAEILEHLHQKVMTACILPQIRFTVMEWQDDPEIILRQAHQRHWLDVPLIVRSSARSEDRYSGSLAGFFCSKLNILGEASLISAVKEVVASLSDVDDQVFLQPMITRVAMSGVAFSCDPNTFSPYYVINYDDESGATDTVTSGSGNHKAFMYVKGSTAQVPSALQGIVALL